MRPALLQREEGRRVVCLTCERRCRLVEGGTGWCRTRRNEGGVLYTLIYGAVSSVSANPIEKKPLYHFYPGTYALTAGSWGCNFGCPWCQNWEISKKPPPAAGPFTSPAAFVDEVLRLGCRGTSISFNEPTLSLEWSLEVFRLARSRGLYNTLVTNGYMTPEALRLLVEAGLDGMNVDLKGKAEAVRRHCKGIDVERVWNACRLAREAGVHLELTTLVIPGVNDDDSSLHEVAGRIVSELGADVPWHVTGYFPAYRFHAPPTSVADAGASAGDRARGRAPVRVPRECAGPSFRQYRLPGLRCPAHRAVGAGRDPESPAEWMLFGVREGHLRGVGTGTSGPGGKVLTAVGERSKIIATGRDRQSQGPNTDEFTPTGGGMFLAVAAGAFRGGLLGCPRGGSDAAQRGPAVPREARRRLVGVDPYFTAERTRAAFRGGERFPESGVLPVQLTIENGSGGEIKVDPRDFRLVRPNSRGEGPLSAQDAFSLVRTQIRYWALLPIVGDSVTAVRNEPILKDLESRELRESTIPSDATTTGFVYFRIPENEKNLAGSRVMIVLKTASGQDLTYEIPIEGRRDIPVPSSAPQAAGRDPHPTPPPERGRERGGDGRDDAVRPHPH